MLRRQLARFPWLPDVLTVVILAAGTVWRYLHVFRLHDPRKYVYSDMQMYVELSKRIARPDHTLRIGDITHPPGMTELLAWVYKTNPDFAPMLWIQFAVAAAIPFAVGALAWLAFGKSSGRWAAIVTTAYFPFVDFAGYFLAENYLALFATLSLVCYFGALRFWEVVAPGPKRTAGVVAIGLLGGFVFSLAAVMKMVAMPAIGGFVILHFLFTHGAPRKVRAIVAGTAILGAIPFMYWQADRCTTANEGKFCTGSNKAPSDFLLGHYGRIQGITWKDPKKPGHVGFGSPAAYQHGYRDKPEVPFLITDAKQNTDLAWKWIRKNPGQSLVLSFEHVWDIFGGSLTWPAVATTYWAPAQAFQYLFLAFLFFPSLILLLDVARKRGLLGLLRSVELAIFAPMFGVMLSVFVATGETRYRIPWDATFIILGVEFFRRLRIPLREVDPAKADVPATEPDEPKKRPQPVPEPGVDDGVEAAPEAEDEPEAKPAS
jgi:4-amino-4-deoxy-L-arabinose transferase-like glycosyltransferase